ncbi:MAG TPA: imidazole glycerol phosphate synthase subunit HisH [Sphingomicrobium sp.]|nr:imidazole glycerol phosphate synthase subunit HisH [Sphingomicrobium sp.]
MKLALVDLGCANLGSVRLAFERLGAEAVPTTDPQAIASADKVVIPGVGAAAYAMRRIRDLGLEETLKTLEQPVLAICLGMQLLFESSEEQDTTCLGVIPATVWRLEAGTDRPVPHMGWSSICLVEEVHGLSNGDYFYFAHSYAAEDGPHTLARADYGEPIPAVVRARNYTGAQFHPERSGEAGARFLAGFLNQ